MGRVARFPPFAERLIEMGKMEGIREALFKISGHRGLALSEEDRALVLTCRDPEVLLRWTTNVIDAKTAADVFS